MSESLDFEDALFRLIQHWLKCRSIRDASRDRPYDDPFHVELRHAREEARRDVRIILGEFGPPLESEKLDDWLARGTELLPAGSVISIESPTEDPDEKAAARFATGTRRGRAA